ncbi:MAG TPA: hypothetical protein VG408_09895 [Actinomycetota bacterium]|nr:hypothetical protein [Actinomycetota bacterium]
MRALRALVASLAAAALFACSPESEVARFRVSGSDLGRGIIEADAVAETVCYEAYVPGMKAAHLMDRSAAGRPTVVLTFFDPKRPYDPADPCVRDVDPTLIQALIDHPDHYFVDLHREESVPAIELRIAPVDS